MYYLFILSDTLLLRQRELGGTGGSGDHGQAGSWYHF